MAEIQKAVLPQFWAIHNEYVCKTTLLPKALGKSSSWLHELLVVALDPWHSLNCRHITVASAPFSQLIAFFLGYLSIYISLFLSLNRISLCSSVWSQTHNPPAAISQVLRL
jgi:hypothetical protein